MDKWAAQKPGDKQRTASTLIRTANQGGTGRALREEGPAVVVPQLLSEVEQVQRVLATRGLPTGVDNESGMIVCDSLLK